MGRDALLENNKGEENQRDMVDRDRAVIEVGEMTAENALRLWELRCIGIQPSFRGR